MDELRKVFERPLLSNITQMKGGTTTNSRGNLLTLHCQYFATGSRGNICDSSLDEIYFDLVHPSFGSPALLWLKDFLQQLIEPDRQKTNNSHSISSNIPHSKD